MDIIALGNVRSELRGRMTDDRSSHDQEEISEELRQAVHDGRLNSKGGVSPVSTWLYSNDDLDLASGSGPFYLTWDVIYDNIQNENELDELPDDIGIDPASIGTDTLTFTEAGIWAFSLIGVGIGPDATFQGELSFGNISNGQRLKLPVVASGVRMIPLLSQILELPAGTEFSIGFINGDPPTNETLVVGFSGLSIVRFV